ncbi:ER degradation-enhancing alpha-mannosidase-like protein 2 [Babylonia areolata]|uniref:ER degradation-enhancing alpha-mannosidase-like protein 2 n=1 Tax=Babylonia areolata TaxID=304850 RepID=UPI003FD4F93B
MTSALARSGMKPSFWFLAAAFLISKVDAIEHGRIDMNHYREKVKDMFYHAYNGYIEHAYPYDELRPLTCDGHDTWGSYSLTLIDALDTLAVMGNYSEFRRVCHHLIDRAETFFDMDINVSVFETNIRVVGGLLSAHLLMKRAGMVLEPGWPCSGPLLRMADHVARKLLPAFDTPTGMPYGTVNLRYGVPKGETTVTCTAGVGTFIVEFGALSRLTGDPVFEKVAMRAIRALWKHRSAIGLLGNHVDVATGKWTALDSGIGGGVDSYFEYLVKGSFMFNIPELLEMFREYEKHIVAHVKRDDWYLWANMKKGGITLPLFTSLDAYWPGIQSMLGDLDSAMKTLHNFHQVWKQFGSTPEFYNIPKAEVHQGREGYPLRPELIESIMYLYRATQDPFLLNAGVDIVEAIEHIARTSCGYATVKDVRDHHLENRMESFFLAETTKYLYLLFDQDNFLHNNGSHGDLIHTPNGDCVVDAGGYVFNTEAHPIDLAAVHCCSAQKKEEESVLQNFHDNLNLLELLDIVQDKETRIVGRKLKRKKKMTGKGSRKTDTPPYAADDDGSSSEHGREGETEAADKPDIQRPAGPGGKQGGDVADLSEKQTLAEESSTAFPQASIKTTVVKTESASPEKLPSQDQHVGVESEAAAGLGLSVNSQQVSEESGRKKHSLDLAQQILDLFSSVSKPAVDTEETKKVPSVVDLYLSVANYSIAYAQKPLLMRCPAQTFHSRLSVWGEMFETEEVPSE